MIAVIIHWKINSLNKRNNISVCEWRYLGGAVAKNQPAIARDNRDAGLMSGMGRSPGIGNSNPLQYSCLENSMNRRAWWFRIPRSTKSQISLSN